MRQNKDMYRVNQDILKKIPAKIAATPHKMVFVSYLVHSLMDHYAKKELSPLQTIFVTPFIETRYGRKIIKKIQKLPQEIKDTVLNQFPSSLSKRELDQLFINIVREGINETLKKIRDPKNKSYVIDTGFSRLTIPLEIHRFKSGSSDDGDDTSDYRDSIRLMQVQIQARLLLAIPLSTIFNFDIEGFR